MGKALSIFLACGFQLYRCHPSMMSVVPTKIDLIYQMQNYCSADTTLNIKNPVPKEHKQKQRECLACVRVHAPDSYRNLLTFHVMLSVLLLSVFIFLCLNCALALQILQLLSTERCKHMALKCSRRRLRCLQASMQPWIRVVYRNFWQRSGRKTRNQKSDAISLFLF